MARIGFIGLGVMGAPIAGHLAKAGHDLAVYNRTTAKAERWVDRYGGTAVDCAAAAAEGAAAVISCVDNDDDLASITLGRDGAFRVMRRDSVYIDHTTASAKLARQLAVEARDLGLAIVDAPMTGGEVGAVRGTLTLMCGGRARAVAAASDYMSAYSQRIVHVGPAGAGQTAKMCNQVAFVGIIQSLAEAIRLAQAAGLDMERVYESISGGAAASWQMTNRWHSMIAEKFDFGLTVDLMRKDLGLALEEARGVGTTLPLAALLDQFFVDVQKMGGGREDASALIRRLPR